MVVVDQYKAEMYLIQTLVSLKLGMADPIHVFPSFGYFTANKYAKHAAQCACSNVTYTN